MGPAKPKPTRKRNRKRKRRVLSDPSSSEELSSSSDSDVSTDSLKAVTIPVRQAKPTKSENSDAEEDEEDETSSSDEPQDDDELGSDEENVDVPLPTSKPGHPQLQSPRDSPSPPPDVDIPPFITKKSPSDEDALKEKFRKFWMASIAEGFRDDLEEIRKEPNLGPSRLALLIESLASGADVFSSTSVSGSVNEMEVVLDQLS